VNPARQLANFGKRRLQLVRARLDAGGGGIGSPGDDAERKASHEGLLGPVVQIACDPPARFVRGLDDAGDDGLTSGARGLMWVGPRRRIAALT
jgi:hypothetical protein